MISRATAFNAFKKVTSTATGCELIGFTPILTASIFYARFLNNNNNGALEKALSLCSVGVLAGIGYSSYKQFNKWTLGATAAVIAYSVCEYFFQCCWIDGNAEQIEKNQSAERNKLFSGILGNVASFFMKPSINPIWCSLCTICNYWSISGELAKAKEQNKEAKELEIYRSFFRASVYTLCAAAISEIGQVAVQHCRT